MERTLGTNDMTILPSKRYIFSTGQIRRHFGGLTIAMMRRAKLFAQAGRSVEITTIDWWLGYPDLVEEWTGSGVMIEGVVIRNIHIDFAEYPDVFLGTPQRFDEPHALKIPADFRSHEHPADLGRKRYWYAPGEKRKHSFIEFLRGDGSVYMRTLTNPGLPEWRDPQRPLGIYDHEGHYAYGFPTHFDWWVFWAKTLLAESDRIPFVIQDIEDEAFFSLWSSAGAQSLQFVHLSHTKDNSEYGQLKDRWLALHRGETPFGGVVVPTEWQAKEWVQRFGSQTDIFVVPHFNTTWPGEQTEFEARANRVVIVSRLVPEKRIGDSLRIFAVAAAKVSGTELHVFGDGGERTALEHLADELGIASRVHFHGYQAEAAREFVTARASLFTSQAEGFGLTILEAMAHGAVPIAFNVRYGPSQMVNHETGFLVESRNIEEAGAALVQLLEAPELGKKLSENAILRASEFTEEGTLEAWAKVIQKVDPNVKKREHRTL